MNIWSQLLQELYKSQGDLVQSCIELLFLIMNDTVKLPVACNSFSPTLSNVGKISWASSCIGGQCVDAKRAEEGIILTSWPTQDTRQETVCIATPSPHSPPLFLLIKTFDLSCVGTRQQDNCLITAEESGEWGLAWSCSTGPSCCSSRRRGGRGANTSQDLS